jgi:Predicted periplasmic or secreted lipoprotein
MKLDDRELQEQVLAALDWEPGVDAARIGVSVSDGVVTLRGTVTTLYEKWTAERAARHIFGVRAVANDLDVAPTAARSDPAIAQVAANALEWDSAIPDNAVKVTVRNGWITLTGTVAWQYQKSAAERIVQRLYGVKGVANSIIVKPEASPADVKTKIESAFKRSAEIDAQRVKVDARDGTVTLTGSVHSLVEREEAERAAWAAPGVTHVDDRLMVVP